MIITLIVATTLLSVFSPCTTSKSKNPQFECRTQICSKKIFEEVEIRNGSQIFYLKICGNAERCGDGIAVCKIDPNQQNLKKLGSTDTLSCKKSGISYKYGTGRKKITTDIITKCNRHLSHDIYTNVPKISTKNYLIILESKDFCEKSYDCLLDHRNKVYDLTGLYKSNQNWQVRNGNAIIYFNICGKLNKIKNTRFTECAYNDTQVCLITKGVDKNLGVFSSTSIEENEIVMTLSDGSSCGNGSYISTKINLICSSNNQGPLLKSSSQCEYNIIWYTPVACPHEISTGDNCTISNSIITSMNLNSINTFQKNTVEQYILSYNLCGSLNCSNHTYASVCARDRSNKEYVFGYRNDTLTSYDGSIQMNLFGETCHRNIPYSVKIYYNCDYLYDNEVKSLTYDPRTCTVTINVLTKLVCIPRQEKHHPLIKGNKLFDICNVLTTNNKEVVDPSNRNLVYILSLCQPIKINSNTYCPGNSAVCVKNISEPNFTKRFKTLGSFTNFKLDFVNDYPTISYDYGICKTVAHKDTMTTAIQFKCRSDTLELVSLKTKSDCELNFVWESKKACSVYHSPNLNCSVVDEKTNFKYDFTQISRKELSLKDDQYLYTITLCSSINVTCLPPAQCSPIILQSSNMLIKDSHPFLIYSTNKQCSNEINMTIINFECSAEQNIEILHHTQCTIRLKFKTPYACEFMSDQSTVKPMESIVNEIEPRKPKFSSEINEDIQSPQTQPKIASHNLSEKIDAVKLEGTKLVKDTSQNFSAKIDENIQIHKIRPKIVLHDCFIYNSSLGDKISLKNFSSVNVVTLNGRNYSINICNNLMQCKSPICEGKNYKSYGSSILKTLKIDTNRSSLEMLFEGNTKCEEHEYNSKLNLKCSNHSEPPKVIKENKCDVEIEWKTDATCYLLGITPPQLLIASPAVASNSGRIAVISIFSVSVLALCIILGITYMKKKKCNNQINRNGSSYDIIYDAQELYTKED